MIRPASTGLSGAIPAHLQRTGTATGSGDVRILCTEANRAYRTDPPTLGRMRVLLLLAIATLAATAVDLPAALVPRWDAAVDRGFAHLAKRQRSDGAYQGGDGDWSGVVGATLLAHLSHGHTPDHPRYGSEVRKDIAWLLRCRQPDGLVFNHGIAPIYQHGLAVLAMAETYGEYRDADLHLAIENGVERICRWQNPRGGWRHLASQQDGDELPSSVIQFMALRAAKNAGFRVPEDTIAQGLAYVRSAQRRMGAGGDGGFVYSPPAGDSNWPRTGAGIACLVMGGAYRDSGIHEGIEYLTGFAPLGRKQAAEKTWWMYGAWFSTLAFQQASRMGVREKGLWDSFYPRMVDAVISRQREDGGWGGDHDPFDTAAALIVLGFRLDYLPIHQL